MATVVQSAPLETAPAVRVDALARPTPRDTALLATAVVAVSFSGPIVAACGAAGLAVAFWRSALAAAAVVPVALVRCRDELVAIARGQVPSALAAGLWLALHFAAWLPSLSLTTVAASTALVTTQPVWTALLARFAGRPVPRRAWMGISVSVAGAIVITGVDVTVSARAVAGDALALAGAIFCAAYFEAGARARRALSTTAYTAACYPIAAMVLLVACLIGHAGLGSYSGRTWLLIAALTLGPQLLGHSVLSHVVKRTGATVVALSVLFEAPGAALIALLWLGQAPTIALLPGIGLLIAGVALVIRSTGTRELPLPLPAAAG